LTQYGERRYQEPTRFETIASQFSPMSALGHKRTFSDVEPMSALPPKADID
jgi:hypothetical protein